MWLSLLIVPCVAIPRVIDVVSVANGSAIGHGVSRADALVDEAIELVLQTVLRGHVAGRLNRDLTDQRLHRAVDELELARSDVLPGPIPHGSGPVNCVQSDAVS